MINVTNPTGNEVRGRRNTPINSLHRKITQTPPPPRPFDAVAYAAALEVLG
jgi:hypothetical protein